MKIDEAGWYAGAAEAVAFEIHLANRGQRALLNALWYRQDLCVIPYARRRSRAKVYSVRKSLYIRSESDFKKASQIKYQ